MSRSSSPIQPLTIGNVVSTAFRLYRSHLKTYLNLSAIAYLWILVPIYGWAKYAKISGVISRLAYQELIDQPESPESAQRKLDPLMWSFWGVGIRVGVRIVLVYFALAILGGILGAIFGSVLGKAGVFIAIPTIVIAVILGLTWVYSRLVVAELPLAVEQGVNGVQSIDRSWSITENAVFRIQGVVLVAGLVTAPLVVVFNYVPNLLQIGMDSTSPLYSLLSLISVVTSLVGGALIMPFWQALKAVLYFDLRNRREGLGLKLSDR